MKTFKNLHPKSKSRITFEQVIRIEADINYCHLILNTGKRIILARTLKAYEKDLSFPFLRVNRSCIINLLFLDSQFLESNKIKLQDGYETNISRRRTEKVSKAIESIIF
jgi:DNA-binding LytR/AlgR family response regulator